MSTFHGRMGRGSFLRAAAMRIGLFAASVIGFPFFLMAVAQASGCAGIGGACGALGLLVATVIKPLAFIALLFSFVGISMRRSADAGLPAWVGLIVPAFLSINYNYFVYNGAPWSFAFSAGVLHQAFPRFALLALCFVGALGSLPSRGRPEHTANPFGLAGLVAAGLAIFLLLTAVPGLAFDIAGNQPWTLELFAMLRAVGVLIPYAMIALVAILGWIAWRYRKAPAQVDAPAVLQEDVDARRPPIGRIFIVALLLAVAVSGYALSLDGASVLLVLAVNFSTILLPTLAIFFLPLLGGWLLIARPGPWPAVFLILTLAPFLHWVYVRHTVFEAQQREIAEIAAIPTMALPSIPDTLVLEGDGVSGPRVTKPIPEIQRTIVKGSAGSKLTQFYRFEPGSYVAKQSNPTALPEAYILLRVGRSSSFAHKGQIYRTAGGPFELRYVDATRDDLVAIWYRAFNPGPSVLPVLTTSGWYRGSNSATTTQVEASVQEFLAAAIKKRI
jgi:uncharacterized membrane protein YhaH (DUF805 family)